MQEVYKNLKIKINEKYTKTKNIIIEILNSINKSGI